MADVQKRVTKTGQVRWDVRYRDHAWEQRKRSFERKLDAQRFARAVEMDLLRGDSIDPRRGQERFEVWAAKWVETLASRKPKTRESYESILHRHLRPARRRLARASQGRSRADLDDAHRWMDVAAVVVCARLRDRDGLGCGGGEVAGIEGAAVGCR
jgi:hypothetical protein